MYPLGMEQQPLALESAEWTVFSESDPLPSLSPQALFLSPSLSLCFSVTDIFYYLK